MRICLKFDLKFSSLERKKLNKPYHLFQVENYMKNSTKIVRIEEKI